MLLVHPAFRFPAAAGPASVAVATSNISLVYISIPIVMRGR